MLQSFKNFDNFKALIRKRPKLWNPFDLAQTNVIEVNYRAKIANKIENINVQNRSLYAS